MTGSARLALLAHDAGFTGEGVLVGVLDTGFRREHEAFRHPDRPLRVVAERDFVDEDGSTAPDPGDPRAQHEHGTHVLGVLAAHAPGRLVGGAFGARYALAEVEDDAEEGTWEEDLFAAGAEWLEALGVDVASSSVVLYDHYPQRQLDGRTSAMTRAVGTAVENGVLFFQGAGNAGHDDDPSRSRLLPPADAEGAIAVGAVDERGAIARFSSDGPTADGRVVRGYGLLDVAAALGYEPAR